MAFNNARTMTPGSPGFSELMQLGRAHESKDDKESVFLSHVAKLGFTLKVPLQQFTLFDQPRQHSCVPMRGFTELILRECPERLLAGYGLDSLPVFCNMLQEFWKSYRIYNGEHEVFQDKTTSDLRCCIPIKVHTDEGTGLRKTPIYQYSWGPLIPKDMSSCNRYFYWSCIFHEQYRKHHAGYEIGNLVLDDLMGYMAREMNDLYQNGFEICGHKFWFVLTGLEGDLPAQARVCHCHLFVQPTVCFQFSVYVGNNLSFFKSMKLWDKFLWKYIGFLGTCGKTCCKISVQFTWPKGARSWNNVPNKMCTWCMADDMLVPYTDWRDEAEWRRIPSTRPWTTVSPFHSVAGGSHENIVSKDIFHLCHLGAVRTFCASLLCYLAYIGRFAPRLHFILIYVFLSCVDLDTNVGTI